MADPSGRCARMSLPGARLHDPAHFGRDAHLNRPVGDASCRFPVSCGSSWPARGRLRLAHHCRNRIKDDAVASDRRAGSIYDAAHVIAAGSSAIQSVRWRGALAMAPGWIVAGIWAVLILRDGGYFMLDWAPVALVLIALLAGVAVGGRYLPAAGPARTALLLLGAIVAWCFLASSGRTRRRPPGSPPTRCSSTCSWGAFVLLPWTAERALALLVAWSVAVAVACLIGYADALAAADLGARFPEFRWSGPRATRTRRAPSQRWRCRASWCSPRGAGSSRSRRRLRWASRRSSRPSRCSRRHARRCSACRSWCW